MDTTLIEGRKRGILRVDQNAPGPAAGRRGLPRLRTPKVAPSTPTCPTPSAPCSRRRQESDTEEGGGTPQAPTLTERQFEILSSVSRGLSNKDIDKSFGISSDGVKKHLRLIFGKLGTATRAEAAAKALHDKLLKF